MAQSHGGGCRSAELANYAPKYQSLSAKEAVKSKESELVWKARRREFNPRQRCVKFQSTELSRRGRDQRGGDGGATTSSVNYVDI